MNSFKTGQIYRVLVKDENGDFQVFKKAKDKEEDENTFADRVSTQLQDGPTTCENDSYLV